MTNNFKADILPGLLTGSICAAALVSLASTIGFSATYGFDVADILIFMLSLLIGIPVALVAGVPVGLFACWAIGFTRYPTTMRAALAGALTGLTLTAGALVVGVAYESLTPDLAIVAGMPVVGALSGLASFHIHYRQPITQT
jgi:hypothetical protein